MDFKDKTVPWVILFGGKDREKIIFRLVENRFKISTIIVPEHREPSLEICINKIRAFTHLSIIEASTSDLHNTLEIYRGGNLLCIGYPYLVTEASLDLFQVAINVHPTLLPKYRGPNSGAYVLANGEKESGSTVHFMTNKADGGQIIIQQSIPLTRFDTTKSMQRKTYEIEPDLVLTALKLLYTGKTFAHQVESEATIFPRRIPEDSQIDPTQRLIDLYDSIRSSDPDEYPAFFYINGEKVCIKLWRPNKPLDEHDLI
jgi:methionyl-tRNA formyltransferase